MIAQPLTQDTGLLIDAAAVNSGMEVYSCDGKKLGMVREMWARILPYGYVAKSHFALADFGPVRGTMHLFEGAHGYIEVIPRRGIRLESDQDLYIPLIAIRDVIKGQALVVAESSADCHTLFAPRPACLAACSLRVVNRLHQ